MTLTVAPPYLRGQDRDLFPASSELTVAQAAALLDVSEAYINELLNIDVLEYRQEGEQRLLDRDKFLEFKKWKDSTSAWLTEEAQWNQEMGLYDD